MKRRIGWAVCFAMVATICFAFLLDIMLSFSKKEVSVVWRGIGSGVLYFGFLWLFLPEKVSEDYEQREGDIDQVGGGGERNQIHPGQDQCDSNHPVGAGERTPDGSTFERKAIE